MAKVLLNDVRGAFLTLWEPKQVNGQGEARCNGAFLIDPRTQEGQTAIRLMQAAMSEVAIEKWKDKAQLIVQALQAKDDLCLHNGNSKTEYEGFAGMMYVSASNKARPVVLNRDKSQLSEKDGVIYSGCYVNVSIDVWAQDNNFGKKINAKLLAVQFNREGAAFSGGESFNEADFQDLTGGQGAFGGGVFGANLAGGGLFGNSSQPTAPVGGIFQAAKAGSFFGEPAQPPAEAVIKRFF